MGIGNSPCCPVAYAVGSDRRLVEYLTYVGRVVECEHNAFSSVVLLLLWLLHWHLASGRRRNERLLQLAKGFRSSPGSVARGGGSQNRDDWLSVILGPPSSPEHVKAATLCCLIVRGVPAVSVSRSNKKA